MSGWSVIDTAKRPTSASRRSRQQTLASSTSVPNRSTLTLRGSSVVSTSTRDQRPNRGRHYDHGAASVMGDLVADRSEQEALEPHRVAVSRQPWPVLHGDVLVRELVEPTATNRTRTRSCASTR